MVLESVVSGLIHLRFHGYVHTCCNREATIFRSNYPIDGWLTRGVSKDSFGCRFHQAHCFFLQPSDTTVLRIQVVFFPSDCGCQEEGWCKNFSLGKDESSKDMPRIVVLELTDFWDLPRGQTCVRQFVWISGASVDGINIPGFVAFRHEQLQFTLYELSITWDAASQAWPWDCMCQCSWSKVWLWWSLSVVAYCVFVFFPILRAEGWCNFQKMGVNYRTSVSWFNRFTPRDASRILFHVGCIYTWRRRVGWVAPSGCWPKPTCHTGMGFASQ